MKYNLWFHDSNSSDWTINGYKLIQFIENNDIEAFWTTFNNVNLSLGMFFFMKDDNLPMWEDKIGGSYSCKLLINDAIDTYIYICGLLFLNELSNSDNIIGISISIKIKYSIIKIWTNKKESNFKTFLKFDINKKNSNNENMWSNYKSWK